MTHRRRRRQAFDKATNILLAIAARAREIRKLLSADSWKRANREAWGRLHEAEDLAALIEALASKGTRSDAQDAEAIVDLLEFFEEELNTMVDRIEFVRS